MYEGQFQISPGELLRLKANNWRANQETEEMGLGKEALVGEILGWPLTSICGGVPYRLDACGLLCECQDAPKVPVGVMYFFFEKLCITHCSKEWKQMVALVSWPLLWQFS